MEEISVTPEDVRGMLDAPDAAAYPNDDDAVSDSELQMPIRMAEALVNDELAPYSDATNRLELTGAALAAAYHHEQGSVSAISQGNGRVEFETTNSLSYWERAKQLDPTGRLDSLEGDTDFWSVTM